MTKRIIVLLTILSLTALSGCKRVPKTVGDATDWSVYDTEDSHVYYAYNEHGFYSDGSFEAEQMLRVWLSKYKDR